MVWDFISCFEGALSFCRQKMPNVTYLSTASTHKDSTGTLILMAQGPLNRTVERSFSREVSIRSKLRTHSDSPRTLTGSLMAATALITPKMIAAEAMSALIMSGQSRRQRPPLLKVVPCPRDKKSHATIICINGWMIKWSLSLWLCGDPKKQHKNCWAPIRWKFTSKS